MSSSLITVLLLAFLFQLGFTREPLINKNGRFTFVDNIETITVNTTTPTPSNLFLRRDTTPYTNCRGTCRNSVKPSTPHLKIRTAENTSPAKRAFVYPTDNEQTATYLVDRVDNWEVYGGFPVYTYDLNPGNSAEFARLGPNPVEIVLDGLCGCTALLVVSQRAVYFAHFFESLSFLSRDYTDSTSRAQFESMVVNFLQTGDDMLGDLYDPNGIPILHSYDILTDFLHHFSEDKSPAIYIITPRNELSDAQDQGVDVSGIVEYGEGLLYEGYINRLREYLGDILPHIKPQIFDYEALDGSDEFLDGHRGKGLYQYDPAAVMDPLTGQAMRGARFFYQAYDVPDPFEEGVVYPRGLLYEDYWPAPVDGEGEDRDLDDIAYMPPVEEALLVCGEQGYLRTKYNCFAQGILCPIIEDMSTLPCGADCYLESQYTCFEGDILCPILDGSLTFPCGEHCYLPSKYYCDNTTLISLQGKTPDENPGQSGVTASPLPTPTITLPPWDIVIDGTTYIPGPSPTTIVDDSGDIIILGPDSIVIGSETIWTSGPATPSPTTIIDDDVTITLSPRPTGSATPTRTASSADPTPTTSIPSSTSSYTTSAPPITIQTSTVLTITATTGSSTFEITFTPTTLPQYTSLTSSTTLTTEIDGALATLVIGPGGIAWGPVETPTGISGFPDIPYPTAAPSLTPAPGPGPSTIPPETSSSSSASSSSPSSTSETPIPFPFPFPTATIVTSTTDSPNGPSVTTITGTTNSDGILIPITPIPPEAAISSASNLLSEISAVSSAVAAFSSDPVNSASATAAVDAIETAKADTNDFGSGVSISGSGLWGIFGGSLSGIASALNGLGSAVSGVISGGGGGGSDGNSGSGSGGSDSSSLSGPLNALGPLMSSLGEDILEAQGSLTPNPPPSTTAPPEPSSTSTSTTCIVTPQTNCIIYCATDADASISTSTTCFSTTCSLETPTACDGTPSTSTEIMAHVCPTERPSSLGNVKQFWYEGLTRPVFNSRPTFTTESVTSSTETSEPTETSTSTSTSTSPDTSSSTETWVPGPTTSSTTETSTKPPPPPPTSITSTSSTTSTTTSEPSPAPTFGGSCKTYDDCPPCADGYYRCCLSGCHGMLVPESGKCGCVRDGEVVSPVCGCL